MGLRVAIQMDPIQSIHPETDATFRLGQEAQRRGYQLFYYTPDKLTYRDGAITARAQELTLYANPKKYYALGEAKTVNLKTMDVILLRQDPPFDISYITTTYLLEQLEPDVLVVNNPAFVRNHPEKLFPTLLKQFMPPTLITGDNDEIKSFRKAHKDIVIKPLYGHSGRAVFRVKPDDDNFSVLIETLQASSREPWVVQKYLPEMKKGEHRIILIDGEYAAIAGRIPPKGETRANIHLGAKYIKAKPTKHHMKICEALGPMLKEKGLIFTGIDIIGEYLTEINITSPGTLAGITELYGIKLEAQIWDAIERKLAQ